MSWTYEYNGEQDKTVIYHDEEEIGSVEGRIRSWQAGMPTGEAKQLIKQSVDNPMIVDLLYGFSERNK